MTYYRHLPLVGFFTATLAVYGCAVALIHNLAILPRPDLLAAALTLDLVILVPLLYYGLLVRWKKWPAGSVVPVFLLSLGGAYLLLPAAFQETLQVIGYLAMPLELGVLGYVGFRAYRLTRHISTQHVRGGSGDMLAQMQQGFVDVLGLGIAARMAAFEVAMLYYALGAWRTRLPADARFFSMHKKSAYQAMLAGILIAMLIEVVGLHLLVALWSTVAAWVLTALSVYSALWVLAEMNAVRLRPVELEEDALIVRAGLRWTIRVPFSAIAGVYPIKNTARLSTEDAYLEATAMGKPAYLITLTGPLMAQGLYGMQKPVRHIGIGLDEPDRFESLLRQQFEAWQDRF